MIDALLGVAHGMGISPKAPSWHHFSIQERVDFIKKAALNPSVIPKHHRKVKLMFIGYLMILGLSLWFLFSPGEWTQNIPKKIDRSLNDSTRHEVAALMIEKFQLQGNRDLIQNALVQALVQALEQGMQTPGATELIAAKILYEQNETQAAKQLLDAAPKKP